MEALRVKTYILERTRYFFTGRPDEPCSGAARLEPTDAGAAPLRSATSTTALRSPNCSVLILRPPLRLGLIIRPRQR
jgi:hypothetical protein